ncbi:hypothetical protein [Nocardia takedensis]|uniref:hypothetical protein n=1 Tax=Nocardia takedensis TaxID=259390 RepID=UPI0005949EB4|nr:hypothetical protein [Nocardia takedensis]
MDTEGEESRPGRGDRNWLAMAIAALSVLEVLLPLGESDTSPAAVATGLALVVLHAINGS